MYPAAITPASTTVARIGSQPRPEELPRPADAPAANIECAPALSETWPWLFRMSIRPVRLASRIPVETALPVRAAWSMTVLRMNVIGADARNGSTGRTNPAARAPT